MAKGGAADDLRFGVRIDAELGAPGRVVELACAAEAAGLDSFWLLDNPLPAVGYLAFLRRQQVDALMACAVAAAATRRITVGPAALVAGLRRPELLAGQCRSLGALSGGRFVLGLGVGWHREEFEALGLRFADRGALADRAVDALRTGDRPVPVWLAGGPGAGGRDTVWSASWLRRARRCDGWLARPQADAAVVHEGLERIGARRAPFTVAHVNYTSLHSDTRARARAMRERLGEAQWASGRDGYWCGDDDAIGDRVVAMVAAGVRHVIAHVLGADAEQVQRWGELARRLRGSPADPTRVGVGAGG